MHLYLDVPALPVLGGLSLAQVSPRDWLNYIQF